MKPLIPFANKRKSIGTCSSEEKQREVGVCVVVVVVAVLRTLERRRT